LIPLIHSQSFQDFSPPNYFVQISDAQSHPSKHLSGFDIVGAFIQQGHGPNYGVGEGPSIHRIAPTIRPDQGDEKGAICR